MVVIACTPCLASTLGPAALSVATLVGLNGSKKKKRTMKGGKNKKNKVVIFIINFILANLNQVCLLL